jgi:hypothetical protein
VSYAACAREFITKIEDGPGRAPEYEYLEAVMPVEVNMQGRVDNPVPLVL